MEFADIGADGNALSFIASLQLFVCVQNAPDFPSSVASVSTSAHELWLSRQIIEIPLQNDLSTLTAGLPDFAGCQ